jgi:hypothetical protein
MLLIEKKVIEECEFEAEREFLLENSQEVEVVGTIIELSDNELKIVSDKELKEMQESAIEFDGFEAWIVKGKLIKIKQ